MSRYASKMSLFSVILLSIVLPAYAIGPYTKKLDHYEGQDFIDRFNFKAISDPTKGHVKYVDKKTALDGNDPLMKVDRNGMVRIKVDNKEHAPDGRKSVRLESQQTYQKGLFIMDSTHMPAACGTWPAFWTFGDPWPMVGEIDIIEGVHLDDVNQVALHVGPSRAGRTCTTNDNSALGLDTGTSKQTNCDVDHTGNVGCGTIFNTPGSFGRGFNAQGGGVYAMEWRSDTIKIWFFPRANIPANVLSDAPNPDTWGKPNSLFHGGCDFDMEMNGRHRLVINTTFCGEWAGQDAIWRQHGECAQAAPSCKDYVTNNPGKFNEAFWSIKSIRVFAPI